MNCDAVCVYVARWGVKYNVRHAELMRPLLKLKCNINGSNIVEFSIAADAHGSAAITRYIDIEK